MRPFLWLLLERRLRRRLPPHAAAAACGDLLEDYQRRRPTMGRWRAEWWLVREAHSMASAYAREAAMVAVASDRRSFMTRLTGFLGATATDLRIGVRTLARQPLVTGAVVLPVALAMAVSTALFSLTDGLLFRELRLARHADSVVAIDREPLAYVRVEQLEAARDQLQAAPWLESPIWTGSHTVFDEDPTWRGTELVERAVSPGFFEILGVPLAIGRDFIAGDLDAGGPPPVVLGHDVWRAHFGADPEILNAPVALADVQVRIVGVAPRTFDFPRNTNVWSLYDIRDAQHPLPRYARVDEGFSIDALRGQAPYPLRIRPLAEAVRPVGSLAVGFLFGATALLLLVSWLQVGALLFSRAAGRSTEIGVRLALGAGRARLLRAFAAEGAVVAVLALALGWLATPAFVAAVVSILPPSLTAGQQVEPDLRTLAFACFLAGAGLLLLAVLPMDMLRRANPLQLLRGVAGGTRTLGWSAARMRSAILLVQVSVTVVLLYVTGLVASSFIRVTTFDLGFDPQGLVIWRIPRTIAEPRAVPRDPDARAAMVAELQRQIGRQFVLATSAIDELRASPEIAAAAGSRFYPVIRAQSRSSLTLPDAPEAAPIDVRTNNVTPEFFDTLGIRLLEGESLGAESNRGVYDVVVVNETLARQLRAQGPVIGQRVRTTGVPGSRIIGVVADYVDRAPDQLPDPQVFLPTPPERGLSLWMGIVRARGDIGAAQARIRSVVERTWGQGTETTFTLMEDEIARATAAWRARTIFLSLLAALCLPLGMAGLFGALSYDTRSRSHEMAVRLALGANPARIRRRVVARALGLVSVGLAAGLGAGWLVGRLMDSYLFGVRAADAATMAAVGAVLLACAWLAALGPAWRASRVDPAQILRST